MCSAGFPEPYTFSLRARRLLDARRADFDLIHDNQCLGSGLLGMMDDGWPVLATLHHPITVDRDLDLEYATSAWRRFTLRRWYGFLGMQMKVARAIPRVVTVSESSKRDIVKQMDVRPDRLHIVPVGVDPQIFHPMPEIAPRAGSPHDHHELRRADEGPRPAARGAGQGPHRARRRRAGDHRQAQGQEQDPRAHRAARPQRRGALRLGRHHRAHRRAVRRGRGRGRAVALRGLLAARGGGDGVRRAARRHDGRRAARSRRHRRRDRADGAARRSRRARAHAAAGAGRRRPARPHRCRRARPRARQVHVARHRARHGGELPRAARGAAAVPPDADRRLRPPRPPRGPAPARHGLRRRAARVRGDAAGARRWSRSTTTPAS